jgi:hypothetical protein
MHGIFFYIGLGAGLAAACGIRPFLPLLLAGGLASGSDLGLGFGSGRFHFLQSAWWLLAVAVALAAAYAAQLVLHLAPTVEAGTERPNPLGAALTGLGLGAGAVIFAGILDAHRDAWYAGLIGGLAAAAVGAYAVGPVIARARRRLPDRGAREALTIYLDGVSLLAAGLIALLHPLGYVFVALLAWLWLAGRMRAGEKYAGLRILRR